MNLVISFQVGFPTALIAIAVTSIDINRDGMGTAKSPRKMWSYDSEAVFWKGGTEPQISKKKSRFFVNWKDGWVQYARKLRCFMGITRIKVSSLILDVILFWNRDPWNGLFQPTWGPNAHLLALGSPIPSPTFTALFQSWDWQWWPQHP